jgi:hypothetical protein
MSRTAVLTTAGWYEPRVLSMADYSPRNTTSLVTRVLCFESYDCIPTTQGRGAPTIQLGTDFATHQNIARKLFDIPLLPSLLSQLLRGTLKKF